MKNTTLRGLFAAALVLVSSSAFAQNNTASASAVIVAPITIDKTSDLNFGTLAGGFVKTVSTTGTVAQGSTAFATGDESAAAFQLTKGANVPVIMNVTGLALSQDVSGTPTALPATFDVEAISDASGSTAVNFAGLVGDSNRSYQIVGGTNASTEATTLTGATAFKVRIGGTVSPVSAQAPGLYRGTITLTAAYN